MAKKRSAKKATPKKSHGELFDKHPNLIWLLPIFFIIAVVAVLAINNMNKQYMVADDSMYGDEMMNDNDGMMNEDMMLEDQDLMYGDEQNTQDTAQ